MQGISMWKGSARLANGNSMFAEILFEFAKPLNAIVKNRRSQRRIGAAFAEHFEKSFRRIGAARGNHRNIYHARNRSRERAIESRTHTVAIHGRDENFPGAALHSLVRPGHRVQTRGNASATHERFPVIA